MIISLSQQINLTVLVDLRKVGIIMGNIYCLIFASKTFWLWLFCLVPPVSVYGLEGIVTLGQKDKLKVIGDQDHYVVFLCKSLKYTSTLSGI